VIIRSPKELDHQIDVLREAATAAVAFITAHEGDPLTVLRHLKFDPVGRHPARGDALNFIEQINQTWTYLAAFSATRQLLDLHPDAGGFRLAPGAHASLPLDIMSVTEGLVGAETFAAVHPRNNGKLNDDLDKLARRPEQHRYVFFMSPAYPELARRPELERDGVQVWSVAMHT